ncbi:hypothetical protein PCIT_a0992 [Pseudoalteromonas citrea]|uniref:Uncharacterized protein n=1 Tax=Pseudoalteromonas citrea TaxID=43655 RepID=A0AAD4FTF4_9GAMM|nr:hypothetical protein PCIT_a0992 [Pseudoalteromonas citrea]
MRDKSVSEGIDTLYGDHDKQYCRHNAQRLLKWHNSYLLQR